jgi:hypothetical protein
MSITTRPHRQFDIAEIKQRADIRDVWTTLGGGKLRHNRGQAWWRGGNGYNVALYPQTDTWHDFATGDGGDVIALVQAVRQCGFREALEWLARFAGLSFREDNSNRGEVHTDWATDLRWATWWRICAEILAERALEELPPWHPDRRDLTALLRTIVWAIARWSPNSAIGAAAIPN